MNKIYYDNATSEQRAAIEAFIERDLGPCQSYLVDAMLKNDVFSFDEIENLYPEPTEEDPEPDAAEVFEWWIVTDRMALDDLRAHGEVVLSNDYGDWWGRCCTGQIISLDSTFWEIYQEAIAR